MNDPIHPSEETLSAYFDNELPPDERAAVEAWLAEHPDSQAVLESFAILNEVGPRIEERLPNESYWLDLPDRVLARIASEGAQREIVTERQPSLLNRIFSPRPVWGWAVAATAVAAIAVGMTMNGGSGELEAPVAQVAPAAVPEQPTQAAPTADPAEQFTAEAVADLSPEKYAERVITTLGSRDNLGESLNVPSGSRVFSSPSQRGGNQMLQQVGVGVQSPQAIPLNPQAQRQLEEKACAVDQSPVERALMYAVKADELGRPDLARQGYAVVLHASSIESPLYWEADARLTQHKWAMRLDQLAGVQRARAMAELNQQARQAYRNWQLSGNLRDCQRAYCMNRTLYTLTGESTAPAEAERADGRVDELHGCLK